MAIDWRDKVVRLLTLRQKWPRNVDLNSRPNWYHLDSHQPFPKNMFFGRPRTIDRSGFTPSPEPDPLTIVVGAQGSGSTGTYSFDVEWDGTAPFTIDPGDPAAVVAGAAPPTEVDYAVPGAGDYTFTVTDSSEPPRTGSVEIGVE